VKAFARSGVYSHCIPASKRKQIEITFKDDEDVKLPRACGASKADRQTERFTLCNDEYNGSIVAKAKAHLRDCLKRFPPVRK
jgi:hypothetical protein